MYILTTDLSFGKFQMAISPQQVSQSTSCLVLGFGGSADGVDQNPVEPNPRGVQTPSWKISNISLEWLI